MESTEFISKEIVDRDYIPRNLITKECMMVLLDEIFSNKIVLVGNAVYNFFACLTENRTIPLHFDFLIDDGNEERIVDTLTSKLNTFFIIDKTETYNMVYKLDKNTKFTFSFHNKIEYIMNNMILHERLIKTHFNNLACIIEESEEYIDPIDAIIALHKKEIKFTRDVSKFQLLCRKAQSNSYIDYLIGFVSTQYQAAKKLDEGWSTNELDRLTPCYIHKLDDDVRCTICNKTKFKETHQFWTQCCKKSSICFECIIKYIKANSNNKIDCPLCRGDILLLGKNQMHNATR